MKRVYAHLGTLRHTYTPEVKTRSLKSRFKKVCEKMSCEKNVVLNQFWCWNLFSFEEGNGAKFIEWNRCFPADGPAQRRGGSGNGKSARTIKFCRAPIPSLKHVIFPQIYSIQPKIDALYAYSPFENDHLGAILCRSRVLKTPVSIEKHACFSWLTSLKPFELILQSRATPSLSRAISW